MLILNTSNKIIAVCNSPLMPDAQMNIPENQFNVPSVQYFVERGMLKALGETKKESVEEIKAPRKRKAKETTVETTEPLVEETTDINE